MLSKVIWVLLGALLLAHLTTARRESEWCHEARRECQDKCQDKCKEGEMRFKCRDDELGRAAACSCAFDVEGGEDQRRGRPFLPFLKQLRTPLMP